MPLQLLLPLFLLMLPPSPPLLPLIRCRRYTIAAPSPPATRNNARALLDSYTSLVHTLFCHEKALKRETEFFLEQMEVDWTERDPAQELKKANAAAQQLTTEFPALTSKSLEAAQHVNAECQRSAAHTLCMLSLGCSISCLLLAYG